MQERPSSPSGRITVDLTSSIHGIMKVYGPKGAVYCCTSSWYLMLFNALPENFDDIAILANSSESSNFLMSIFNESTDAQMPSYEAYYIWPISNVVHMHTSLQRHQPTNDISPESSSLPSSSSYVQDPSTRPC